MRYILTFLVKNDKGQSKYTLDGFFRDDRAVESFAKQYIEKRSRKDYVMELIKYVRVGQVDEKSRVASI